MASMQIIVNYKAVRRVVGEREPSHYLKDIHFMNSQLFKFKIYDLQNIFCYLSREICAVLVNNDCYKFDQIVKC